MPSPRFASTLDRLLHISHVLGCNEKFVQAGGGNTSVKTPDGRTMLIKASGTPLGKMSADRGWVAVELAKIHAVFASKELRTVSAAEREKRVLAMLGSAVIEPRDACPSVETPLHALLDTVIMHSHPVAGNALSCHPDGKRILAKLFADLRKRPPLWVPYIDPGSVLAFEVAAIIAKYRAKYGVAPDILLLQNHGLFVADSEVTACVHKHQDVLERIEKWFTEQFDVPMGATARARVEGAVRRVMGETVQVRVSARPELVESARGGRAEVFAGALSPDHVVYTGPCAAFVTAKASGAAIEKALRAFHTRHGVHARVLVVKGAGVCVIGDSEKKLDAAEALAVSAVQIAQLSGDTIRHLRPRDVAFIMNWEAEHYRAKQ